MILPSQHSAARPCAVIHRTRSRLYLLPAAVRCRTHRHSARQHLCVPTLVGLHSGNLGRCFQHVPESCGRGGQNPLGLTSHALWCACQWCEFYYPRRCERHSRKFGPMHGGFVRPPAPLTAGIGVCFRCGKAWHECWCSPQSVFFYPTQIRVGCISGWRLNAARCSKFLRYTPSGADRVLGNQQSTGASHESRTRLRDARHCMFPTNGCSARWEMTSRAGSPPYDGPQGQKQSGRGSSSARCTKFQQEGGAP